MREIDAQEILTGSKTPDWIDMHSWVDEEKLREYSLELNEEKFEEERHITSRVIYVHGPSSPRGFVTAPVALYYKETPHEEIPYEIRVNPGIDKLSFEQRALALMFIARKGYRPDFLPNIHLNPNMREYVRREVHEFFREIYMEDLSLFRILQKIDKGLVRPPAKPSTEKPQFGPEETEKAFLKEIRSKNGVTLDEAFAFEDGETYWFGPGIDVLDIISKWTTLGVIHYQDRKFRFKEDDNKN